MNSGTILSVKHYYYRERASTKKQMNPILRWLSIEGRILAKKSCRYKSDAGMISDIIADSYGDLCEEDRATWKLRQP